MNAAGVVVTRMLLFVPCWYIEIFKNNCEDRCEFRLFMAITECLVENIILEWFKVLFYRFRRVQRAAANGLIVILIILLHSYSNSRVFLVLNRH